MATISHALPVHNFDREKDHFAAIDISLRTVRSNAAEILLTSRYPAEGFALNTQSEMIVRILEGRTAFESGDEEVQLPEGSTILVPTNRAYCWKPDGYVRLFVVSTPPWTPEQHQNVR